METINSKQIADVNKTVKEILHCCLKLKYSQIFLDYCNEAWLTIILGTTVVIAAHDLMTLRNCEGARDSGGDDHCLWQPRRHGPDTHLPWQVRQ